MESCPCKLRTDDHARTYTAMAQRCKRAYGFWEMSWSGSMHGCRSGAPRRALPTLCERGSISERSHSISMLRQKKRASMCGLESEHCLHTTIWTDWAILGRASRPKNSSHTKRAGGIANVPGATATASSSSRHPHEVSPLLARWLAPPRVCCAHSARRRSRRCSQPLK
jgi:hypothetical protein